MRLYTNDYMSISPQDQSSWEEILESSKVKRGRRTFTKNYYRKYPKAVRHYISLFPNNLLDVVELKNVEKMSSKVKQFETILNTNDISERDILRHIKDTESHFIIGSILKDNYNFGHHGAYLFPEFMLGTTYRPDYLLIGRNSGGYEMVFIELENPKGHITKKEGELGSTFTKGIEQIEEWDSWLDSNFKNLQEIFTKDKSHNHQLPDEFINYDKSRIHYVVVAGRRENFKDKTYRIKRKYKEERKITLLHYDNLVDGSLEIIGKSTYKG